MKKYLAIPKRLGYCVGMKSIYAIVNENGLTHGDAFTLKMDAQRHAAELNRWEKKARSPRRWSVASVHPEMAGNLNVNPYATR